jgi:heat shock protein HslJ
MKKILVITFGLLAVNLLNGQDLNGTKWLMMSFDNLDTGKSTQITASTKSFLHFESDSSYDGRFCNTFSGRVRTNPSRQMKLTVSIATKLSCLGLDAYENELFELLPKVSKYKIEDGKLYLFTLNHRRITLKAEK